MIDPPRETMPVSAPRGHRDVAQQHAGVDGEVVHALLRLLDQRVAIDLPGQIFGPSADLLERLIDRDGADRHGRVAEDPLARLVDVACRSRDPSPCRRPTASPSAACRPLRRSTSDTAELPMLALIFTAKLRPMIIGSSSGWLMFAGMIARPRATSARTNSASNPSRDRDELHLRGDDAAARVVQLGHRPVPRTPATHVPRRRHRDWRSSRAAAAAAPSRTFMPLRSAGVVHAQRRFAAAERNLAHRNPQRPAHPRTPCASWETRR